MKLVIGLGNPEKQYDGTRHNVGFFMLDVYAEKVGVKWQEKTKFKALVAELPDKSWLVKPITFYNLVGESVRAVADFYKIPPEDILVIHDDLALPLGAIRTREQGSDAGNNGIKSINAHLGPNTRRVRIGTGCELREHMADADFVLSKFSTDEKKTIAELEPKISDIIDDFLNDKFFVTTHK